MFNEQIKHLNKNNKLSALAHKRYMTIYARKYNNENYNKKDNLFKMEYHNLMLKEIIKNGKPNTNRKKEIYNYAKKISNSYYK